MSKLKLALGTVIVAAVAAAPAAAREHSTRHHTAVLHKCVHGAAVAPRSYLLACGDGNTGLRKLHWQHWGAATATAAGTGWQNSCTPNCAAGKPLSYSVEVKASHLAHGAYGRLVVSVTGKRPKGVAHASTYKVDAHGPVFVH